MIGAFVIAGVLFYLSFCASDYICLKCEETSAQLEMCGEKIKDGQYKAAYEISIKIKNQWDESSRLLSIVLGDSVLSLPSKDIYSLCYNISDGSYENSLVLIRECQGCLDDIIGSQRLSFGNIL